MSRIGRLPVAIPSGVDVTIDGAKVTVKGPKGTLSHTIAAPITVAKGEDGVLEVNRPNDERESTARVRGPLLVATSSYMVTCRSSRGMGRRYTL